MSAWKPLLTGEDAQRARQHLDAVARDLEKKFAAEEDVHPWQAASLSLLYAYLFLETGEEHYENLVDRFVDLAIEGTGEAELRPALYGGFTGIGWVLEHLDGLVEDDSAENPEPSSEVAISAQSPAEGDEGGAEDGAEVDEALFAFLEMRPWRGDYDLIGGLVGMGVYFLERYPDESGAKGLSKLLDHFEELAVDVEGGKTWVTPPELLPEWQRELAPEGYYNLGLAHGVPGIAALLGHMIAQGVEVERARKLLGGAARWILAQRQDNARQMFRSWLPTTDAADLEDREGGRLAWCYNDLGLAAALYLAGRQSDDEELAAEALEILRHSANLPHETAGINDAPLCHGTVGVAHIFNRVYQSSGDPVFRDAALRWYRATFDWRRPGTGFGGYQAYAPFDYGPDGQEPREDPWDDDPSFLAGALGLGLALLAATSTVVPNWDRLLLVDIPPEE